MNRHSGTHFVQLLRIRIVPARALVFLGVLVVLVFATASQAFCEEKPAAVAAPPIGAAVQAGTEALGKVKNVAVGSKGATITLEGNKQVKIDLSGVGGAAGGPNYVGWAMMLFGLSIVTRLLSTIARIMRPFTSSRRRER